MPLFSTEHRDEYRYQALNALRVYFDLGSVIAIGLMVIAKFINSSFHHVFLVITCI